MEELYKLKETLCAELEEYAKKGKMSAGDIAANFDMTQATVSYHLSILKKADLLFETREKNYIYYELNTTVFEDLINWMMSFKKEETE